MTIIAHVSDLPLKCMYVYVRPLHKSSLLQLATFTTRTISESTRVLSLGGFGAKEAHSVECPTVVRSRSFKKLYTTYRDQKSVMCA